MASALDKQIQFVTKVLELKLTEDVALAAIWFRGSKAWRLSMDEAVAKFKKLLSQ